MRIVRRLTAVTLQGALLTMSLVGSGYACDAAPDHSTHMAMGDMAMPGMDMPGMPMQAPAGGQQDRSDSHSDCSFPWSSGDCQGMASCAPSVMGAEQSRAIAVMPRPHDELAMRAEQLRSVTRAPEPPPPRA